MNRHDKGLKAVELVRGVREQDSRIGLQHALAEEHAITGRLAGYRSRLATAELPETTTPGELISLRAALGMLGDLITTTAVDATTAATLCADARSRWTTDKARLAAVEHLLEQRAKRRQAAADRRTAAELDDIAAQRWQRLQDPSTGSGTDDGREANR